LTYDIFHLFFFFTVLVVLVSVRGINLHPAHFIFLGAVFFSFHLFFAYLVDHVIIELAFLRSTIVSLGLVVAYLWLQAGSSLYEKQVSHNSYSWFSPRMHSSLMDTRASWLPSAL